LSDLCAARRRARQPARPHLPAEEHAGGRRRAPSGDGQAYRPLPLLPLLHDDLPLRGALHAPRRSRPPSYRRALPPALRRAAAAPAARNGADPPAADARGAARRPPRQAIFRVAAEAAAAAGWARAVAYSAI